MNPREYLNLGWKIFPCHSIVRGKCTCGKEEKCTSPGKHPRTANGVKDATSDVATVDMWWTTWPEANIGLACGAQSNVIAVDIDQRHSGFTSIEEWETLRGDTLPSTLIALTGGGGRHLFFKYPGDGVAVPNRNGWLKGVDIKSDGGYVILTPGSHISGGTYRWHNWGTQLAVAPLDLLQAIRGGTGGSTRDPIPDAATMLEGIPEGQRDDFLFRWACKLRRQLQDDRAAVELLVLTAARNAKPPFPDEEARAKVEQAFKQEHDDEKYTWSYLTSQGDPMHPATDIGNANRFVDRFIEDLRYVPGLGWLHWTDTGWRTASKHDVAFMARTVPSLIVQDAVQLAQDGNTNASIALKRWATTTQSVGKQSAILDLAPDDQRIRHEAHEFDADDFIIGCRNGVLDLRTGKLRDYRHEDLITKNTNIVYDPDFRLPAWDNFLEETTQGDAEVISYLQRAAGYTLTGSNEEECFFVISGPPMSGKSTYIDALLKACGDYGRTTQSDTFMYRRGQQTDKNEIARLAGVRMLSVSEIREGELFNEQLIKQFTGGDMVSARFLYQETFEFRPRLKLWIGTNHEPDARDDAMWRRIKKIPFINVIPESRRDNTLKPMLSDPDIGGKAVLAWAVRGAMAWAKDGLHQPTSITSAVMDYRAEQDRFGQFIDEVLMLRSDEATRFTDVYQTYTMWSKMNGELLLKRPQFTNAMKARGLHKVKHEEDGKLYIIGAKIRTTIMSESGIAWQ